ncbi:MAG: glutathione peroxidase [Betaproteobacteria bacterium]|nr:glutathione peroxidase [Betaproteobacteria bacterium]
MHFKRMLTMLTIAAGLFATLPATAATCPPLLDHSLQRLQDSAPQSLCQYQGKVILVVNTASFCGFTGQYEGLEAVYDKYKERGLVVIGFPSNDFGDQEPGSNKEIADFCRTTYGIKFPMMAKTDIAAPKTHAFYKQLIAKSGTAPKWNFHKYLIDRSGKTVESFNTLPAPDSRSLIAQIERRLAEKP